MRVLIKERNKLSLISKCIGQIVEINLNEYSQVVAFLLMKNLYIMSEILKKNLEGLSSNSTAPFVKKMSKPDQFKETL